MAKYRIMSFDGGGIRGALTAALLRRLIDRFPRLLPTTDLFAGTSAGSFIALGLASGKTVAEIVDLFSERSGEFIFTPSYLPLFRPKSNNASLATLLGSAFPQSLRLRDLQRRVLVLSFRVIGPDGGHWTPVFFNNFPNSSTLDARVIDVALSSSAAPVYFPSFQQHIDGGVVATNPSLAAIATAVDARAGRQRLDEIVLLSIGTGFNPMKIQADTSRWGAVQWVLHPSPPFPIISILTEGAVEADTLYSFQFLGQRFFRLNPTLPEPVALDEYRKVSELLTLAESVDLGPVLTWIDRNWF